jgi:hypothetical protein
MRRLALSTIAAVVCAFAAHAIGDVEVFVGNGTTVQGEFSPADEREALRAEIPGGAVLVVRARGLADPAAPEDGPKPAPPVVKLELFDPAGELAKTVIGGRRGARLRMRTEYSGRYRVVVSGVGETAGRYAASISWKSPRRFRRSVALEGGEIRVPFTADAGAIATLSITPSRGEVVHPRLLRIEADGFTEDLLPPDAEDARTHKLTGTPLPIGGDLFLVVSDSVGETGGARVSVRVTPPPFGTTKIDVGDDALGLGGEPGGENPVVTVIGPEGGILTVPEGGGPPGLIGTSIEVPPETISFPTSVVIAEAVPPLAAPAQSYAAASAPVFFGPQEDAEFPQPVTLTLVYDAATVQFPTAIRVFERLSDGSLRLVPRDSYLIDFEANTISFPVLRLGSYQVFAPLPIGPDAGGYTARAAPFAWEDITETGTPHLAAPGLAEIELPYAFTFYGEAFTKLYVSDDGFLTFQPFASATEPNAPLSGPLGSGGPGDEHHVIAPLWDALTLPAPLLVFSETRGEPGNRRTIIQWRGVGHADGGDSTADFEVILYEGRHEIRFQYNDVTFGVPSADYGASATVGIRAPGGHADGRFLQWSFNAPLLDFCDAILFADYF